MKSRAWIAGVYAEVDDVEPYASGYPEPQEIFLARSIEIDQDDGGFVYGDDGRPQFGAGGLLLRWDEIEFLEFIHSREENENGEEIDTSHG